MNLRSDRNDNLNNSSLPVVYFEIAVIRFKSANQAKKFGRNDIDKAAKVAKFGELNFEPIRFPVMPVGTAVVFDASALHGLHLKIREWTVYRLMGYEAHDGYPETNESLMLCCKLIPQDEDKVVIDEEGEVLMKVTEDTFQYWDKWYCKSSAVEE